MRETKSLKLKFNEIIEAVESIDEQMLDSKGLELFNAIQVGNLLTQKHLASMDDIIVSKQEEDDGTKYFEITGVYEFVKEKAKDKILNALE